MFPCLFLQTNNNDKQITAINQCTQIKHYSLIMIYATLLQVSVTPQQHA